MLKEMQVLHFNGQPVMLLEILPVSPKQTQTFFVKVIETTLKENDWAKKFLLSKV